MTVKAYSYLRFSSAAQAEGDSLRRQLKAAMDWAAERPDVELDTSTRDLGVSAFKGEHRVRGALASFLRRVEAGQIAPGSYFLIESFDRLSRENETVAINLLTSITLKGIKVVTLTDGAVYDDTSDAMDLMRAIIVMSRAHEENKARGKKLAAAWADKKRRARETGEILSRRGPAWTRFDEASGRFELVPDRALIVRRIFQEAIDGMGATTIASRLNADKVPSFTNGDGWHPAYILTILHSRSTCGWYQPTAWSKRAGERAVRTPDGEAIPDYYPRAVEDAVFDRAQAVLHTRLKHGGRKGRRGKDFPNLIMGLGRCEECGGTLILGNRPNSQKVRFFRCYQASRKHNCANRTTYLCRDVEELVEAIVVQGMQREEASNADALEVQTKADAISELKRRIETLLDQAERGLPFVEDRLRQRQIELVALERDLETAKSRVAANTPLTGDYSVIDVWRDLYEKTGPDLFAARAKANALLQDRFDWLMPVMGGAGVLGGRGQSVWFNGPDFLVQDMWLPEGAPVTLASVEAANGPLAQFLEENGRVDAKIV